MFNKNQIPHLSTNKAHTNLWKMQKISVRFLDNIKICHILERKNDNLALWVGLPCNYFPSPNKTVLRQQLLCLSACLQNKHNFFLQRYYHVTFYQNNFSYSLGPIPMQMILVAVFSAVILVLVIIIVLIVFRKRCCDGFKGSKGSQHGKPIIEVNLSISNHAFVMLCSWTLACAILCTY